MTTVVMYLLQLGLVFVVLPTMLATTADHQGLRRSRRYLKASSALGGLAIIIYVAMIVGAMSIDAIVEPTVELLSGVLMVAGVRSMFVEKGEPAASAPSAPDHPNASP